MATQQKAQIYVSQEVWDEVDDMSDVLRKMEEEGIKPDRSGSRKRKKSSELSPTRLLERVAKSSPERADRDNVLRHRLCSASRISAGVSSSSTSSTSCLAFSDARLCTARFTRGTSEAPALSSSIPRPSKKRREHNIARHFAANANPDVVLVRARRPSS